MVTYEKRYKYNYAYNLIVFFQFVFQVDIYLAYQVNGVWSWCEHLCALSTGSYSGCRCKVHIYGMSTDENTVCETLM